MKLKNNFITEKEEILFTKEFDKIKSSLSIYAKNEIIGINKAYENTCALMEDDYYRFETPAFTKSGILKELKKVMDKLSNHPNLIVLVRNLYNEINLMTTSCQNLDDALIKIIKLQLALKMRVNLLYGNAISSCFKDTYMNIVNKKYIDIYEMENEHEITNPTGRTL